MRMMLWGKIWFSKTPMNSRRNKFSLHSLGAKLVACGGEEAASVEIYDIAGNQCTLIRYGFLEHHICPASVALNNRVYIIGGAVSDGNGTRSNTDYVSIVDVDNAALRRVSSLPFQVSGHACALLTVPNTFP